MAFISAKTGKAIQLGTGYETGSPSVTYEEWKRQREEKRAAEPVREKAGKRFETNNLAAAENRLENTRRQAMADLDTETVSRTGDVLKRIRAAQGRQTAGDRVNDTLSAAAQSYGAGLANAVGTAVRAGGQDPEYNRRQIARLQKELEAGGYSDGVRFHRLTEEGRRTVQDSIRRLADEAWRWEHGQGFAAKAQSAADRMQDDSARSIASAKEGAGALGQLAVDVGVAGTQMGLDALTAALTGGSALVPMAVRSFGGGAQEARRSGADLDRQLLYGAGSSALSVGTEKISNIAKPFQKMFGRGAAETIAGSLAKKFGENQAVQLMQRLSQSAAGRIALSAIGEGGEEVVEDVLQPFLKRATFDPNARFDAGEAGNDFLVGAILGGLGGGVEAVGSIGSKPARNQAETGAGTEVRAPAGVDAPRTETGVQGVQSGTVEPVKVGRVTTIKRPYQGQTPVQAPKNAVTVQVDSGSVERAQNRINGARGLEGTPIGEPGGFKATLKKKLLDSFNPTKGVEVEGVSFDGKPYLVDINNKVVGKVVSDKNLTAEKIALLDVLPGVVRNSEYVGSGEYTQHGSKKKPVSRYDYFETLVSINGKGYIAKFDVEVLPDVNNYRTYQVVEMDLVPKEGSLVGPAPTAASSEPGPVEGTRPLNSDPTIPQGADSVKFRDDGVPAGAQRQRVRWGEEEGTQQSGAFGEAGSGAGGVSSDDGLGAADAGSLNSDYDRLQAQNDEFHPEGANAARPVDVPVTDFDGRNIPKSTSTMMGAEILDGADVRRLEKIVADGLISFDTIRDADALSRGETTIRDLGFDGALERYRNAAGNNVATKDNTVLGELLMRQAARGGNESALAEIVALYARNSTNMAQAMQAQSILRKLSPEAQLVTVQKALNALNEKYGTDVQLEQADVKAFLEAGDQEAREAVRQRIVEKAARAVPGTFKAKFDAWRYLAMLGNPRTHIRNLTGSLFFQPLAAAKNRVGALEEVLVNSISDKKVERTKSVLGAAPWGKLAKEARADWANAEEFLGRTSKYMEGQTSLWEIEQNADPFQQSGRVGKTVGWLADRNGRLLEAEDTLFKRWIYSQSLAGYLKANGVKSIADADPGLLNRARNYAAQEALRNTFNDKNAFSDAVAKLGGARNSSNPFIKGGGYLVEGVLPFKRTPANVLARGMEYSPIGAAASMADLVHKGVTGQATAETVTKGLDRLAAGLSGSALLAAGFLLGGAGYITGGEGDDRDQNAFDELTGHQSYALETADGTSVTLDWLAPEAIPFFMGVELQRALLDRGMSLEDAWNVVKNTSEPMLEMSMLQGLNDMFESAAYARNKGGSVMGAVASSAFTNYFTQALPTLFGQLERTAEDRRMTTYTDSGSRLPKDAQYLLGKAGQKIPGWDYNQIPYVDAWGREEETGDALERALRNLFNPAYISQVQVDEVEKELQRVKDATGDGGVFPDRAPRFFQADGGRKDLTAEEYLKYSKARGQESYRMVKEGVALPEYRSMTDQERAGFIADLYKYADQNAKAGISDYEVAPWVKNAWDAREDVGVSPAEYIALYRMYGAKLLSGAGYEKTKAAVATGLTVEEYAALRDGLDADGNGSVSQEEAQSALEKMEFSREQKADLWEIINKSWKRNPYE